MVSANSKKQYELRFNDVSRIVVLGVLRKLVNPEMLDRPIIRTVLLRDIEHEATRQYNNTESDRAMRHYEVSEIFSEKRRTIFIGLQAGWFDVIELPLEEAIEIRNVVRFRNSKRFNFDVWKNGAYFDRHFVRIKRTSYPTIEQCLKAYHKKRDATCQLES